MTLLPFSFVLAQTHPVVGDVAANRAGIRAVRDAHAGADLIVFPELALSGYTAEDLYTHRPFLSACRQAVMDLVAESTGPSSPALLIGVPWEENGGLFNAALLIDRGAIVGIARKTHLPDYGVFDDSRVFTPAALGDGRPLAWRGHSLGVMICEDMWQDDVVAQLAIVGCDVFIALNGSPFTPDKDQQRHDHAARHARKHATPFFMVNMVGGQDHHVYDGGSFALDAKGQVISKAPFFKDAALTLSLRDAPIPPTPVPHDETAALHHDSIVLAIRDYCRKTGHRDVLIGLSGGIDSAVVAVLACKALGSADVECVMMPSDFTAPMSQSDAAALAKTLGCGYRLLPIHDALKAFERTLDPLRGLAHENTQSRIRGTILMALSNNTGALVLATGNKSELATGYCTLYGDMCGGFAPIKDLYKTEIYALARFINRDHPIIPERIITRPPTAELRTDQTDQDTLPPYDVLDRILFALIEEDANPHDLIRAGEEAETVSKIANLVRINEFKRRQGAIGPSLSRRPFGTARRYPIANGWRMS